MKHESLATYDPVPQAFLGETGPSNWQLPFCLPVPSPDGMDLVPGKRVLCLRPQTSLLSYLEGGKVQSLEMLQGLTEGDELLRLV